MATIRLKGQITEDGRLEVELPDGLETGEVNVVIETAVSSSPTGPTWTDEEIAFCWREPFRTAADLYNYVSIQMPKKHPGSLGSQDYWKIVTFMLIAHGASVPPEGVDAQNAPSVTIRPSQ